MERRNTQCIPVFHFVQCNASLLGLSVNSRLGSPGGPGIGPGPRRPTFKLKCGEFESHRLNKPRFIILRGSSPLIQTHIPSTVTTMMIQTVGPQSLEICGRPSRNAPAQSWTEPGFIPSLTF